MKNNLRLGISAVLEQILNQGIKQEVKDTAGKFLFPLISAVLLIVLIVQLVRTYKDWKEKGEPDYEKLIVCFICLALCIAAPSLMWGIIGW